MLMCQLTIRAAPAASGPTVRLLAVVRVPVAVVAGVLEARPVDAPHHEDLSGAGVDDVVADHLRPRRGGGGQGRCAEASGLRRPRPPRSTPGCRALDSGRQGSHGLRTKCCTARACACAAGVEEAVAGALGEDVDDDGGGVREHRADVVAPEGAFPVGDDLVSSSLMSLIVCWSCAEKRRRSFQICSAAAAGQPRPRTWRAGSRHEARRRVRVRQVSRHLQRDADLLIELGEVDDPISSSLVW